MSRLDQGRAPVKGSKLRRPGRAKVPRPFFEPLEDRLMLDAGGSNQLPLDIVVGRTLSAYFVADVQNSKNQETITLTVYNEQATTETGVFLTDTLEPGVTIASASQQPDQSGQDLAWSLGTIQGFDRASVTLTVDVSNPIPLQLDRGASGFAMFDAGAVSASTPAATLRAGSLSDPSLLASTADANTTDPFIQEQAAALNYDPVKIFDFVRDQIGYESYAGSLRGARGTLWNAAGNSLDKASLLVALLRTSGVPSRYDQGTITPMQAQTLILSMFPQPTVVLGCISSGTPLSDPSNDPQLLAESEDHFWVELDTGSGFMPADPDFATDQIGQTVATPTAPPTTFTEAPDALRQKVEIKLKAELSSSAASLFGFGPSTTTVLDITFDTVELAGNPVSLGNFVSVSGAGAVAFSSETITYSPYLKVDAPDGDLLHAQLYRGQDYQEVLTNFPLASTVLTGLVLNVTTLGPEVNGQRSASTVEKTLVDRIGFAARQSGSGGPINLPPGSQPAVSPYDIVTLAISPSLQSSATLATRADAIGTLTQQADLIRAELAHDSPAQLINDQQQLNVLTTAMTEETNSELLEAFLVNSDQATSRIESEMLVEDYSDSPRIIALSSSFVTDPSGQTGHTSLQFDILRDTTRSYALPIQASSMAAASRIARGLFDSDLEGYVLGLVAPPTQTSSSLAIFNAALNAGIGFSFIDQANLVDLTGLPISDEAKARITAAVQTGQVVLVPDAMVEVNSASTIAWFEVDPNSGDAIFVSEDGAHEGIAEDANNYALARYNMGAFLTGAADEAGQLAAVDVEMAAEQRVLAQGLTGRARKEALYAAFGGIKLLVDAELDAIGSVLSGLIKEAFDKAATAIMNDLNVDPDPSLDNYLLSPPIADQFPNLGSNGLKGVAIGIIPDPGFTVSVGRAPVPTVFLTGIKNLNSDTETFSLKLTDVSTGFSAMPSVPQISIPAGQTAEVGICLTPSSVVPAEGTDASFGVAVTSTTNPAVMTTTTETFTVPSIDAVSLTSSPTSLSSSPGVAATTTLTLQNDGNVPETVTLSATTSSGLSAGRLTSITLAVGATATEPFSLTPDASATLNQTLATTITASYGPSSAPVTTTSEVDLLVRSAQTVAVSQASIAAGDANNQQLASVLSDLGNTLTLLQSATSGALFAEARTDLENLYTLLSADPALASFLTQLQPITAAATVGDLNGMLGSAQALFNSITSVLNVEAIEQFTVALTPIEADLDLGQGETLSVQVTNTGNDPETLNLSAGTLPSGVSVVFGQNSLSLSPNQSMSVPVTLSQTLQSTTDFELNVTAAATVEQHTDSAMIAVRPSVADVLSVTVNPSAINSGDPVSVSAHVFNTANVARNVLARMVILGAAGNVVSTLPDSPFNLVPGTGNISLNLGQIPTSGLTNGLYTLNVSLLTSNGSPLPGQSSQADFEIGQPVTASVAASANFVPPGTSTVTTTITTSGTSGFSGQSLGDIQVVYGSPNSFMFNGKPLGNLDAPAFVIENTSSAAVTNGILSIGPGGVSTPDSFDVGRIASGSDAIIVPGLSNDGQTHPSGGFFAFTGSALDTSEVGPSGNDVQFEFTGSENGGTIDSGVFTPAATYGPSEDDKATVNFLGGPNNADLPCTKCFGPDIVANLTGSNPPGGGPPPNAAPITVEVGYADSLRANPFFPIPWRGSPNTVFVGSASGVFDAPGILITNNGSSPITVNDVSVTLPAGQKFDLWGSNVIPAGGNLILTQTTQFNFDLSDYPTLPYPQTYADGETAHAAHINITVNGVLLPIYLDTGHILTTGGSDRAVGGLNESLNWRQIGTTGVGNPGGTTVSIVVTHNLPASGYNVDPTTISPTPTSSSSSQVVWNAQLLAGANPSLFQLIGTVSDMVPGEVRKISLGTSIAATTTTSSGQRITTTLTLAPVTVAAEHIISIDPPTQTVDRAATATYTVSLTNPLSTDETYTLSTIGLDGLTVGLASSIVVPAGQTVTTPLTLTVPAGEAGDKLIFTVSAQTLEGGHDSVEGQLIIDAQVVLQARALDLALTPEQAIAGQGTSALDQVTVTNVGTIQDSYNLSVAGLPQGIATSLGQTTIDVAPGVSNFRDVSLLLTPEKGTAPGRYLFTVTAASTTDPSVTSTTSGTLTVVEGGVHVALDPGSGAPGSSFQETVTNTGTTADTYHLALAGPAALVSSLGMNSVTLAAGASQIVPISTGAVNFAVQGSLPLTAAATSTSDPSVYGAATSDLSISASQGMTAAFNPGSQTLSNPGMATFLLMVRNTGNTEDSYSATIIGANGPVTATLVGLDGSPTRSIPIFRLPGLSTGAIKLQADIASVGQGTVTVGIQSLTNATINASPLATVVLPSPPPTSVPPSTHGPQVTEMHRYGYHMMPTTLVLTFDQSLDTNTAQDADNYQIMGPHGRPIHVKSAVYDPTTKTVTLHTGKRINIHYRYKLTVDGAKRGGLTDSQGLLLDSTGSGKPGSDYHSAITWRNLVLDPPLPKTARRSRTTGPTAAHRPKSDIDVARITSGEPIPAPIPPAGAPRPVRRLSRDRPGVPCSFPAGSTSSPRTYLGRCSGLVSPRLRSCRANPS